MLINTNKRHQSRINLNRPVWWRNGNGAYRKAQLLNLSEGGAAIETNDTSLLGTVQMVVRLKPGFYLNLKAKQVWQADGAMGVQFVAANSHIAKFLGTQVTTHLARFITNRRCMVPRALLRRDRTVPSGMSRMSATS